MGRRFQVGVFRNTASLLFTRLAGIPLSVASSILLARYLSVSDRGIYGVANSLAIILVLASQLGWPSAAIYRLRRVGSEPARVSAAALTGVGIVSAITVLLGWIFRARLDEWFLAQAPPEVLYLVLATVPFQLTGLFFCGIARGMDRFYLHNAYRFLNNAGRLFVLVIVLVIANGAVLGALAGGLISQAAMAVFLVIAVIRHTGFRLRIPMTETIQTLRFGIKNWIHAIAGNLHERLDVFMLAFFLQDPSQVAYYVIAVGVLEYLKFFPESMAVALLPRLAELAREDAARLAATSIRHALLWVMVSVLLAFSLAPLLIPLLYGEPYRASVLPFLILLPGVGFLTMYRLLTRYFVAIDRQASNISVQVISTALNVGLNLVLIPVYGILGAASASLLSYFFEGIALSALFLRHSGLGVRKAFLFRRSDFSYYRHRIGAVFLRLGYPPTWNG